PKEIVDERKLLPTLNHTLYVIGHIHNHRFSDTNIYNRDFSNTDMKLMNENRSEVFYLVNIHGDLEFWGKANSKEVLLGTGFEANPRNPTLTPDFNGGKDKDLSWVNYYDVFK